MTAIFRNEVRTSLAQSFVDKFQQDSNSFVSNRLYCGISDTSGTDRSADVLNDDDSTNGAQNPGPQEQAFWYQDASESIIGVQKVEEDQIALVIDRSNNNWSAQAYNVGDYVVCENLVGVLDVFLCVAGDGVAVATTQPEYQVGLTVDNAYFEDGKASIIADGPTIRWKYLFRVPASMNDNLTDDAWCPVPYNTSISADSGDGDVTNARPDAASILQAHHVMVKIELLSDNGGVNLPNSGSYSKVGLIVNPLLADNSTPATATSYLAPLLSNDGVNPFPSGDMVYLSHRGPITRQDQQTEDVKVILAI